jgi:anaerobic ribonucleoside-triphosphate reductase activating protein
VNKEVVFVLEPDVGRVTVEISQVARQAIDELAGDLGNRVELNCAKPVKKDRYLPVLQPDSPSLNKIDADSFSIWLYRLYHNSVVDGPGRRSVIQTVGCSILCSGCHIPKAQKRENGSLVPISPIVKEIVDHRAEHDGVTILGGEPFDQPDSVAELVSRLKTYGVHITVYSGFTIEQLIERKLPAIDYILTHIDLLIDGPFISEMREGAGEYRGSRNQHLIGR